MILNEFYRVTFRKKLYRSIEELQADLDRWMEEYNETRSHQGRCPMFISTCGREFARSRAMPISLRKVLSIRKRHRRLATDRSGAKPWWAARYYAWRE